MNRKQIVIFLSKYLSYLINTIIILAVLGFVAYFVYGIYLAATAPA